MTSQTIAASLATLGAAGMVMLAGIADAAELRVIGSPGTRAPYTQLVPGFEKATGNKVVTIWGGVNEVARRVAEGETADVVMLPAAQIDGLIKQGKLIPETRVDVGDVRHRRRRPRRRPEDRHRLRRRHQESVAGRQDDRLFRRTERRSHRRSRRGNGASPTSSSPRSSRRARTCRSARWWPPAKPTSASSR